MKLTARVAERAKPGAKLADGKGLWLFVTATGRRTWTYRYMLKGKAGQLLLGDFPKMGLAEARNRATALKADLRLGIAPRQKSEDEVHTFQEAAEGYFDAHKEGWRSKPHTDQWWQSVRDYALPALGEMNVRDIGVEEVMKVLLPIWDLHHPTALRVRARVEAILNYATAREWRDATQPAAMKLVQTVMGKRRREVEHFEALSWRELPAFLGRLNGTVTHEAFRFLILTACRSNEALGARWSEIDGTLWRIPAPRMKSGRVHEVPLSEPALAVLERMATVRRNDNPYVFPGYGRGKGLSRSVLQQALIRLRVEVTPHGMRSAFKDWARHQDIPEIVSEMALAHAVGDATVQAYGRDTLIERRREVMERWGSFCSGSPERLT